jgi:hypothetical protein
MYEDADPWPFRCPKCGEEFTEGIGRLKTQPSVKCPGIINTLGPIHCSMTFMVSPEEFGVALAKARRGEYDPWPYTWIRKVRPDSGSK